MFPQSMVFTTGYILQKECHENNDLTLWSYLCIFKKFCVKGRDEV